jgi:enediyne biosynthesis protein E4
MKPLRLTASVATTLALASLAPHVTPGSAQPAARPVFREIAAETGLRFDHFIGSSGEYYLPEILGSGGALLDYDGDGDLDVLLLQGSMLDPAVTPARSRFPPAAGEPRGHRLFRNELERGGGLRFSDVTEASGLKGPAYGMGAAAADYDNDGDTDLYLTGFGASALYRNDAGRFSDVTAASGTGADGWSTSAAFLDYDRDGDLDLFVARYVDFTVAGNKRCVDAVGARDYCLPAAYRALPDRLYRNDGGSRFSDVTEAAGLLKADGPGLGVVAADVNGDGWTDLYVANDGAPNQLWINKGNGSFEDQGLVSGTAYNAQGLPEGSMGIAAEDFDADADLDLFVTNLPRETNTLYLNQGRGLFQDATDAWGLGSPSATRTGFGAAFFDYDNDGWLDLFVANGAVTIVEALRGDAYPFRERSQLFRNPGRAPFLETSEMAGPALARDEVSRGAAFGDLDNDGDVDVLVTNNNGPARLFENLAGTGGHWLKVRLRGATDNLDGIGSRVGIVRPGLPTLWRRAHSDGSYLSASDLRVHFGLGTQSEATSVLVEWPSGRREAWPRPGTNRLLTLRQGTGEPWPVERDR